MKRLMPVALLVAAAVAVPAYASKPSDPGSQGKGHSHNTTHTNSKCKHSTLTKSYVFGGTLTAAPTLTQTAGQSTPTSSSDDLFTAGLSLTVTNANKYAKGDHPKGSTYSNSFTDVAVGFGQNADNTPRTPQAGDHVTIHARRAFKVKHNCTADASNPVGGTKYKSIHFGGQPTP